MNEKNTPCQVELVFSDSQTLKELLKELLFEKISTLDSDTLPE